MFDFDWTPLGAVGNLAVAAGRNKAATTEADFMLRAKSMNLADARARDELRARNKQAERGFQLQLAASDRESRKLDMQARAMEAEGGRYQEARTTRDANLKDWEAIKDELHPDEYTRGLIAIRAGKVPPQLTAAQVKMNNFDQDLTRLRQLQMASASYQKTLEGYYLDEDGKTWRDRNNSRLWFGNKVSDPALIQQLNEANAAMQDISAMRKIANQMFEDRIAQTAPADNAPQKDKLRHQADKIMSRLSEEEQQKCMKIINMVGLEEWLRLENEHENKVNMNNMNATYSGGFVGGL